MNSLSLHTMSAVRSNSQSCRATPCSSWRWAWSQARARSRAAAVALASRWLGRFSMSGIFTLEMSTPVKWATCRRSSSKRCPYCRAHIKAYLMVPSSSLATDRRSSASHTRLVAWWTSRTPTTPRRWFISRIRSVSSSEAPRSWSRRRAKKIRVASWTWGSTSADLTKGAQISASRHPSRARKVASKVCTRTARAQASLALAGVPRLHRSSTGVCCLPFSRWMTW
mmetsp:Transcript_84088/g.224785  ORF Transcript_84088/g.224785 Transcript_84088/m.224785 type:complete len:225 (+) Transcript_84088:213-887(+)